MDSLEARLRFITILKSLQKTLNVINITEITASNPDKENKDSTSLSSVTPTNYSGTSSVSSSVSTVSYANDTSVSSKYENPVDFYLKNYKDHYEDFHQCLIDTLKKFNVLDRLPIIIYYVKLIYVLYYEINNTISMKILNEFMVPSLCEILNLILPERDVMSLTNLSLCQDMIKNLLSSPNIEKIIDESLQLQIHQMMESRLQFKEELLQKYNSTQLLQPATAEPPTILNRMEMDRDRHKRSKEQNWKVQRQTTATNATETLSVLNSFEFQQMWDNVGPLEPADLHNVDVLNGIARESYLL